MFHHKSTRRSRRRTSATASTSVSALVLGVLLLGTGIAHAQYLDPAPEGGYLPDGGSTSVPDLTLHREEPAIEWGLGLGIGPGFTDFNELDEAYFEPNDAKEFGSFAALALEIAGWVDFNRSVRLGLAGGTQVAGSGRTYTSFGFGGLLLEGGLALDRDWHLWMGGLVGLERVFAQSKDDNSVELEYESEDLYLRLQAQIEREVADNISIQGTAFAGFSSLMSEEFRVPNALIDDAIVPLESDFAPTVFGVLIGITFE